jgi:hypothetical protein
MLLSALPMETIMARIFFVNITRRIHIRLSAISCHALVVMEDEIDY